MKTKLIILMIFTITPFYLINSAPNPASTYCIEQGGILEIKKDTAGGEYGVCQFKDGSECEEWAYLNGECKPGQPTKYEDTKSNLPDFVIYVQQSGWVENNTDVKYTTKEKANFYYYKVGVRNTSNFSKTSQPVKFIAYTDPVQTFELGPLNAGEYSGLYDIFFNKNNDKSIYFEVNPGNLITEADYSNNTFPVGVSFNKESISEKEAMPVSNTNTAAVLLSIIGIISILFMIRLKSK